MDPAPEGGVGANLELIITYDVDRGEPSKSSHFIAVLPAPLTKRYSTSDH